MSNRAYAQYTISDINDGVGILKIEEQYCKSIYDNLEDLESHNPEWLDYQPVWENGYYIWTRSKITWDSDDKVPNPSYTEPVLATTFQTLYSDIVNQVIPNIAVKDSNGKWSLVSGVLQNTYLYTDEERNVPVYLSTLGSAITTTANGIRQEVSDNYISSDKLKGSYVVCNTQADVSTKTALCSDQEIIDGFELYDGMAVNCVFANGNTAYNSSTPITLSVNGTTAYPIRDFDGTILTEEESKLYAGAMVTFIYDDTAKCWKMQNTGTVAKISSNSTLIEQTSRNILIQATSGTNVTDTDVGDALISFINVAPDEVKISASIIDFEGTAIFSDYLKTNDLSTELTNRGYITSTKISETYATKTAIVETQRIYKQTTNNSTPSTPSDASSDWVVSTSDVDKWTTQRRSYNPQYPYLWTCEQRKTAEGKLLYTPVLLDDTTTVIDGGKIIANSITSSAISTDLIKSNNYSPPTGDENSGTGTYPYSVSGTFLDLSNGNIYTPNFMLDSIHGNAYLKGTIETGAGHIGGFVITDNSIYHNKRDISSVDLNDDVFIISSDPYVLDEEDYLYGGYATLYEVYMGLDGISCGFGKFAVDSSGELYASNATIKGNITATSGSFGLTDGYYEISNNGLIGYRVETVYYFKMIEILANTEYDEGSVKATSLSVDTSTKSYSYSDILAIDAITGIDTKVDDGKLFIILKTNSTTPISQIFDGTINSISCAYTYTQSGEELGGFESVQEYTGLTTPSIETSDYVTGTEIGYDYLKTDELIANGGTIGGLNINDSNVYGGTRSSYDSGTGFFLDSNGNFGLGSNSNYIVFNGSNLNIKGSISTGSKVNAQDTTNNGTYIDVNGNMATSNIIAHGGTIGGFDLSPTQLNAYGTGSGAGTSNTGLSRVLIQSAPGTGTNVAFGVASRASTSDTWTWKSYIKHNGLFVSTDADITGKITATEGNIGGWAINSDGLYKKDAISDLEEVGWKFDVNLSPGSLEFSWLQTTDEEGNSVSANTYKGTSEFNFNGLHLYSSGTGIASQSTNISAGDIRVGGTTINSNEVYNNNYYRSNGTYVYGSHIYNNNTLYCFGNNEEVLRFATKTTSVDSTGISFYIANGYYAVGSAGEITSQNVNVYLSGGTDDDGKYLRSYPVYNRTYSDAAANVRITSAGTFGRSTSSSIRYKHDVEYLTNEEYSMIDKEKKIKNKLLINSLCDEESILNIPLVRFKYNEGYVNGEKDFDYTKPIFGVIAEDVANICKDCATYIKDENGNNIPESYNINQIVFRMLYVVQQQEKRIKELESQINKLKN